MLDVYFAKALHHSLHGGHGTGFWHQAFDGAGWHTSCDCHFLWCDDGQLLGVRYAQRYGLPPKALIVPSLICMMPGIAAYKAMVSMVQIGYFGFSMDLFIIMMHHFFEAIFVISALVLGLSIPGILFYRRKPIV